MADQLTASQMEQSVQEYLEQQALNSPERFSPDAAIKSAAEARAAAATKARAERLGPPKPVDPNAAIDLSKITEEQFRQSMTSDAGPHTGGRDVPKDIPATAAAVLAPQLLTEGLHPDYMQRYEVDPNGNVPEAVYQMAVNSKAMHLSDPGFMTRLNSGDVRARQIWASIRFILASGPAKKPVGAT
jgi:hypothetical protein